MKSSLIRHREEKSSVKKKMNKNRPLYPRGGSLWNQEDRFYTFYTVHYGKALKKRKTNTPVVYFFFYLFAGFGGSQSPWT